MNEPFKEAMHEALPDKLQDPRDTMFRRQEPKEKPHPVAAALSGAASTHAPNPEKTQESKRKCDALKPLA